MLTLDNDASALALSTLRSRGIEGTDATTSLASLCRLADAPSLEAWRTQHQGAGPAALMALYGSDIARAALVLLMHLPPPPPAPPGGWGVTP